MARTIFGLALLTIIATQALAQFNQRITLYSGTNCQGPKIDIVETYVEALGNLGWNNAAQSVGGVTGGWILYDNAFYNQGPNAATEYISNKICTNLVHLSGQASSIRFAGDKSDYRINSLTLYQSKYFQGQEEFAFQNLPNFSLQQHSSLIITGKSAWTVYDKPNYQGNSICVYPPNTANVEPYFVYDMDVLINIPYNSIRSVKLGCF